MKKQGIKHQANNTTLNSIRNTVDKMVEEVGFGVGPFYAGIEASK